MTRLYNLTDEEKRGLWKEIIAWVTTIALQEHGEAARYLFDEADYGDVRLSFNPKDTDYQDDMTRLYKPSHRREEKEEIAKGDAAIQCFDRAQMRYRGQPLGNRLDRLKGWFEDTIIGRHLTYIYPIEEINVLDVNFYELINLDSSSPNSPKFPSLPTPLNRYNRLNIVIPIFSLILHSP